jgi:hypothetical protein
MKERNPFSLEILKFKIRKKIYKLSGLTPIFLPITGDSHVYLMTVIENNL